MAVDKDVLLSPETHETLDDADEPFRLHFMFANSVVGQYKDGHALVLFVGTGLGSNSNSKCQLCHFFCQHAEVACAHACDLRLAPDIDTGPTPTKFIPGDADDPDTLADETDKPHEKSSKRSVSPLLIPPIPWPTVGDEEVATYPYDYGTLTCLTSPGEQLRCACKTSVDPTDVQELECTVYDMDWAYCTKVLVQKCHSFKKCFANPDLSVFWLFNYDNTTVVTHRLMHKFDSYFTGHHSTFLAFSFFFFCGPLTKKCLVKPE